LGQGKLALLLNPALDFPGAVDLRLDPEPGDACLELAIHLDLCPGSAPQYAVDVPGLLHAAVERVGARLDLVVLRLTDGEQLPASGSEDRRSCPVVDAVSRQDIAWLRVRHGWEHVRLAVRPAGDPRCRRARVKRLGVGERPQPNAAGSAWVQRCSS
jgi:hypothetical protein